MKNLITNEKLEIKNMIHVIRGQQVMLDSDLAELYGYTTKRFNEQVNRNIERFPKDFMFQLNEEEIINLSRCQNVTSIQVKGVKGGRAYKISNKDIVNQFIVRYLNDE